jgi:hypothetical protein
MHRPAPETASILAGAAAALVRAVDAAGYHASVEQR